MIHLHVLNNNGETMQYKIFVEYTKRINKAGRLIIRNGKDNTIVAKMSVAIPLKLYETESNNFNKKLTPCKIALMPQLLKFDNNGKYENQINKFKTLGKETLLISGKEILFAPTAKNQENYLQLDNTSFILHNKDFQHLLTIISNTEVEINMKKVSFIWLAKNINTQSTSINEDYNILMREQNNLLSDLDFYVATNEVNEARKKNIGRVTKQKDITISLKNINQIMSSE